MSDKPNLCYNCHHSLAKGGHFVPPSFGDPGFYACESFCDECKARVGAPQKETEPNEQ